MSSIKTKSASHSSAVRRKSPASVDSKLERMFGPPPLAGDENQNDYDQLYGQVRSDVAPQDIFEELWVRDITDMAWEAHRLRRLKAKLIDSASTAGVANALRDFPRWHNGAERTARGWAIKRELDRENVDEHLEEWNIDIGVIQAAALSSKIDSFEAIDRLIAQVETRRSATLREIDRHRDVKARRLREVLSEIEDAEFEEVEATEVKAIK